MRSEAMYASGGNTDLEQAGHLGAGGGADHLPGILGSDYLKQSVCCVWNVLKLLVKLLMSGFPTDWIIAREG